MLLKIEKKEIMEFYTRLFHGSWMALGTIFATMWGGSPFIFLLAAVCTLSYAEWFVMSSQKHLAPFRNVGTIIIVSFQQCIFWLRVKQPDELIKLFLIVWGTDTGAYMFGKYVGGPKLLTSISPNKTIAGMSGGIMIGTAMGYFWGGSLVSSFIISCSAQIGDLLESAAKRLADVKDSNLDGLAIPGHGGILDRIDALLIATPIAFWFTRIT